MTSPAILNDLKAALTGAAAILPAVLSSGVVIFAPLGAGWLTTGITAAFVAAVVSIIALALIGGSAFHLACPKTAVAAILAGACTQLMTAGAGLSDGQIVLAVFAAVMMSGVIEFTLGATGLSRFVKFVPQPVIAGFLNGLAVLVVLSQLPALTGISGGLDAVITDPSQVRPGALILGTLTIIVMIISRARLPGLPAPLIGLITGAGLYHIGLMVWPLLNMGGVIGDSAESIRLTLAIGQLPALFTGPATTGLLAVILSTALSLAVINAIQTLLSAAAIDGETGVRHDSGRELRAQGIAHMLSGALGGMTSSGTVPYTRAALTAGGTGRRTALLAAVLLAVAGFAAEPVMAWLPKAVVAGMILIIALGVVDRWTGQLIRGWTTSRDPAIRREIGGSLFIVIVVTLLVALTDLVIAVGVGMALSLLAHLQTASRTVVHRAFDGSSTRSRVARPLRDLQRLENDGHAIRILALQGPLFFGATDSLMVAVEQSAPEQGTLILDLRRITSIDSSGAAALAQIDRNLSRDGVQLLLAGLGEGHSGRAMIREAGHMAFEDDSRLFADFDSALTTAENRLLSESGNASASHKVLAPEELDLFLALDRPALDLVTGYLHRQSYSAGDRLIVEGDRSDAIYILASGQASVLKTLPDGRAVRLATYLPGVVLGEMGVLGDTARTADIVIDSPAVCYRLTATDFEAICRDNPATALALVRGLSRELSKRLAATSATLRELER
ncbi:MAG: SulP family inorganic anion transporter [Rhodospirillales bacterium]